MAREAAMSERTMIRRFKESLGASPGEWLTETRVDAARQLLEAGATSIEEVAELAGFGSVATLRHHFRTRLGTSPAAYRNRFAPGANGIATMTGPKKQKAAPWGG